MSDVKFVLDEVMDSKGFSVRKLSISSGVSRIYINQLRTGVYSNPGIVVVAKLAKALEVQIEELLEGYDNK